LFAKISLSIRFFVFSTSD